MNCESIDYLADEQIEKLWKMYESEWWTRGRQLADVRNMLRQSDLLIGLCDSERKHLTAFARIVTDYVYKALILDVIVEPAYRGRGLGRLLMESILHHPSLKSVRHFELYCLPELVPFYKKWKFTEDLGGLRFMRLAREIGNDVLR